MQPLTAGRLKMKEKITSFWEVPHTFPETLLMQMINMWLRSVQGFFARGMYLKLSEEKMCMYVLGCKTNKGFLISETTFVCHRRGSTVHHDGFLNSCTHTAVHSQCVWTWDTCKYNYVSLFICMGLDTNLFYITQNNFANSFKKSYQFLYLDRHLFDCVTDYHWGGHWW